MYIFLFLVGVIGFFAMAGLSFMHSGHDSHSGNHGSTGEHLGGHASHGHHHARAAFRHAKGAKSRHDDQVRFLISPLDIFSLCLGAGATGELLRTRLPWAQVAIAAFFGAVVFNYVLVKPLMGALLRFASRPSDGLEGKVAQKAEAATRFDPAGRGLVKLSLDGEVVQLLGILDSEELRSGVRVLKGDPLIVIEVDAARNQCHVTRELAS